MACRPLGQLEAPPPMSRALSGSSGPAPGHRGAEVEGSGAFHLGVRRTGGRAHPRSVYKGPPSPCRPLARPFPSPPRLCLFSFGSLLWMLVWLVITLGSRSSPGALERERAHPPFSARLVP